MIIFLNHDKNTFRVYKTEILSW